jgi:hypothetical protein
LVRGTYSGKGLEVVDMTETAMPVTLDAALWARVDAVAERSGRTRDQVIQDSLRRDLAGVALAALLARIRGRDELTGDEALQLAAEEQAAARAEFRAATQAVAPAQPAG